MKSQSPWKKRQAINPGTAFVKKMFDPNQFKARRVFSPLILIIRRAFAVHIRVFFEENQNVGNRGGDSQKQTG
ncbi:MAG: hypothetical protein ACKOS8_08865 [Gemmataceae bacterium]